MMNSLRIVALALAVMAVLAACPRGPGTTDASLTPLAPAGLAVTARNMSELRATWAAPDNAGRPAITGYDVQFRQGTSGTWSDHEHGGTATTADIGGLLAATSYQVQVRAKNANGNGPWTEPASGTTAAKPVASLTLSPARIDESGSGNVATVAAKLEKAVFGETTITVSAVAVSPAVAGDFRLSATTVLTIAAGATTSTGSVTVTAVDNDVDAADREVTVSGSVTGTAVTAPSAVTLTIVDDDASPVFADGTVISREVAENTAAGTAIGAAFSATDADGDEVSYTLAGDDAASFAIGEDDGVLATKAALDREAKASYAVTVRAADEHGNATDLAVTITVTDMDEPPSAPTGLAVAAMSVSELRATWAAPDNAGRPAITGYDVQYRQGTSRTWSDHEHGGTATTADIGGLLAATSYQVQVRAKNANGNGPWTEPASGTTLANPVASLTLSPARIDESGSGNVATVTAELDKAAPGMTTITVSAVAVSPAVAGDFRLSTTTVLTIAAGATTSTGSVTVTAVDNDVDAADREVTVSGSVTVTAVTAPSAVTLTIVDDDASPVFADGTVTSREVAENTAAGTAIGAAFSATDADGDEVSYTLAGDDAASFAIGEDDGVLATKAALDHEAKASYAVTVRATDEHGNATDLAVTITVTNVDESPPAPTGLAVAAMSVSELRATWTAPDNAERPAITGYDVQYRQGTNGTWSDHAHGGMTATADIGGLLAAMSYQVQVRAKNAEGNGPWTQPVSGTTEAKPVASLALTPARIDESGARNVATVTAELDKAASGMTTITVSAAPVSPAVAADFRLSTTTVLTIAAGATTSTGTVTVTAVDNDMDAADKEVTVSGEVSGTAVIAPSAVTLTIADDDASPVFADGTATSREVPENATAGTAIGAAFSATDADGDEVRYMLAGDDAASFAIGEDDGVLATKAALDHEAKASYVVTVRAADKSGNAADLAVTITVTDAGPAQPPVGLPVLSIESVSPDPALYTLYVYIGVKLSRPAPDNMAARVWIDDSGGPGQQWRSLWFDKGQRTTRATYYVGRSLNGDDCMSRNPAYPSGWAGSRRIEFRVEATEAFDVSSRTFLVEVHC